MIAECQCQNSLDGNVCDVTTGQCGLCKPGFFGDFCKGKITRMNMILFRADCE